MLVETSFGEERAAVGLGREDSDSITAQGMDGVALSACRFFQVSIVIEVRWGGRWQLPLVQVQLLGPGQR